jgi:trk system potassium uptake protein
MQKWHPRALIYPKLTSAKQRRLKLSPPSVLLLGFLVLIFLGTLLLLSPWATTQPISFTQALFTATSAVTVTGLVVVDTGTAFTTFGLVVIASLIQVGGLGFMTFAVLGALALGSKLGIGHQKIAQEAFGETSLDRLGDIAKAVIVFSLIIELFGVIALTAIWFDELGFMKAIGHALFYTVSAYNNAGFALASDSLTQYAGSLPINLVISGLFILGGIGFLVVLDFWEKRKWQTLSANSKLIIKATLYVNILAWALIWLLEFDNQGTLGNMALADQAIAAWFQAVTPRTAGFNSIPIENLRDSTTVFMMLLMFIGGGSLSTASGVKLGTFILLVLATWTFLKRESDIVLYGRKVPESSVIKALSLTFISIVLVFFGIFGIVLSQDVDFLDGAFEVVSALSTVGLSRGITASLTPVGDYMLIALMVIGRVGPLTAAYLLATATRKKLKYPEGEFQVG